jgi:FkbM family methyltransferase
MTVERIETVHGLMLVPDTDTHQHGWLKSAGVSSEDLFIREVCDLLREKPPGTSIDVGANFGCWCLPLAKVSKLVIAIEPQWEVYKLLMRTLALNGGFERFEVINAAAGDVPGVRWIPRLDLESAANFGDVAVGHRNDDQPSAAAEPVACVTIDALLNADEVRFIKVDVQGMEQAVLRGAERVIRRCRPYLFVEAHPDYCDARALRRQIEAMGYYCLTGRGANYLAMPL